MGVTIKCKKTNDSIDLGYGGFNNLRLKVAELAGKEWYEHYQTLFSRPITVGESSDDFYEQFDKKTLELIANKKINQKIVSFCLQSDCGGYIGYGACKRILNAIGEYDDKILYGYCGRPDCARFRDFKRLLQQCADNKCDLIWY